MYRNVVGSYVKISYCTLLPCIDCRTHGSSSLDFFEVVLIQYTPKTVTKVIQLCNTLHCHYLGCILLFCVPVEGYVLTRNVPSYPTH